MPEPKTLDPEHLERLNWFEENQGRTLSKWPSPIGANGNLHLLNKLKGIHKPRGFVYPTGIRVSFGERYGDGPDVLPDGSWRLLYHMELREKQADPISYDTNSGLLRCMSDAIPIGVVHQVSKKPNRYHVFGLGVVTDFEEPYFIIEGPVNTQSSFQHDSATNPGVNVQSVLQDARNKTLGEIYRRRGQGRFRKLLLESYDYRCAVTGCSIVSLLEAAHILPHRGTASDIVQNGLLLRADVHTLFDLGLLRVNTTDWSIQLHEVVRADPAYDGLHGRQLKLPLAKSDYPDPNCFTELYRLIAATEQN